MITMRSMYIDTNKLTMEQAGQLDKHLEAMRIMFPGFDFDSDSEIVDCIQCGRHATRLVKGEPLCNTCQ